MEILSNFTELSDERLAEYAAEVRAAFDALAALEAPTAEEVAQGEEYADHLDAIHTEQVQRTQAAEELTARAQALRDRRFAADEPEDEPEEEHAATEVVESTAEVVAEEPIPAETTQTPSQVAALARRTERPTLPETDPAAIVITAAADVPDFATGSEMSGWEDVSRAVINRMRGFGTPSGDGETENLQHYGVAHFRMDYPEELQINRNSDDMEVLTHAADEHRLPGNSLTAANGWCAPSEVLYDLCSGETTEGILSLPEVQVNRGGIKYTSGPDFSTIYSNIGFSQTEAQAISGTTKTCFEVPCPSFTDVRLGVTGLCIKAPILTNAAYPELVQRWLTGGMIAQQHKVNAAVIASMLTAAGTARVMKDLTSTAGSTLGAVELLADQIRDRYRLSLTASMEVVAPFWLKGAIRNDLALRTGQDEGAITDQLVASEFAARHINVQFVYDWQDLTATDIAYPATVNLLVYPAGTFVKGVSDVINLNAVYDAASLATNIYTALFFEQGLLTAQMCYNAVQATIAVCNSGKTGAASVNACNVLP